VVTLIANPFFARFSEEAGVHVERERQQFRITPWHNDPVSDTRGEAF
jgi:cellobiose phosphorylase